MASRTGVRFGLSAVLLSLAAATFLGLKMIEEQPALAADPLLADDAKTWKGLATEEDIEKIIKSYDEEVKKALKSPGVFARGRKKLEWVGKVIAVLGNIGVVGFEGDQQKAASALRDAGTALSETAKEKDFEGCKKAYDTIKLYPKKITGKDSVEPLKWTDMITSEILMKAVADIDSATGKTHKMESKEYKKTAKDMAMQHKLMAYLAIVEREQNTADDWKSWCDQMREDCLKISAAFASGNQESTKTIHTDMQDSCTKCHNAYRSE